MTLRDTIEADATAVFLNTGEFAESVTYKPRIKPTGDTRSSTRSISAVVFREQMTTIDEDGGETIAPRFLVHVANDSTDGINSDELDLGGDKITFPVRDGLTASDRTVTRLVTIDNGMLVLECR